MLSHLKTLLLDTTSSPKYLPILPPWINNNIVSYMWSSEIIIRWLKNSLMMMKTKKKHKTHWWIFMSNFRHSKAACKTYVCYKYIRPIYIYIYICIHPCLQGFFKGFSIVAMVARAFQSRANMWQLVKKLLNYFYLTNLCAKMWLLCVCVFYATRLLATRLLLLLILEATICSYK